MEMILKNVDNRKSPKTIIGHKYTMFLDISSRHNFLFFKLKETRNTNYPIRILANILFFSHTSKFSSEALTLLSYFKVKKKKKRLSCVYGCFQLTSAVTHQPI